MSGQFRINVETCTPEEYLKFLEDLRIALADHWTMGPDDDHTYPILALQSNSLEWIDIRLETNNNSITLRLSRGNLYVKGFQTSDGRVFELAANRRDQVFPGSILLGYGGSYRELLREAGRRSRGRIINLLEGVPLSLNRLRDAVNSLANDPQNRGVAGESLLQMVWMISEAARFTKVADAAATRTETPVTRAMAQLVMLWADVSRRVVQAFAHPLLHPFMIPDNVLQDLGISTAADVLSVMGVLLFTLPNYMIEKERRRRPKREVAAAPSSGATLQREATLVYYTVGATLAEVFYVTIDNIDGENPGELYGTITVTDSYSSQDLFNRLRDDYQSIRPGTNAWLTGPAKPISANDYFTIVLDLKDRDALSPDDEVVNDQFSWNPYEIGSNEWNRSIKRVVRGQYGQATVCYGVFENAVVASVEVKVVNADGEEPVDAYGWVKAGISFEETTLFSREKGWIPLRPQQLIPLARSTVVVPLDVALKISAYLFDHDYLSPDDNFANGYAFFTPKTQGSEKHNIRGTYGQLEVQVTWSLF